MHLFLHFSFPVLFFCLIGGHFFGDFVFQNDFVAKAKNFTLTPDPRFWVPVLLSHCWVHAMLVLVITGTFWTGLFMLVTHWCIDWFKCAGLLGKDGLGFVLDQLLHLVVVFMIAWALAPL